MTKESIHGVIGVRIYCPNKSRPWQRGFGLSPWVRIFGSIYARQKSTTKCGVYLVFCLLLSGRMKLKRRTVSPDRPWSIFRLSLVFGYTV
ncbi:hypothetical protein BDV27DRAFT_133244 [Aspergillus caelatus]|uniref:Uncharacterized protein n=1 Tax=Aspergillus caelatus TaxID=61420 RepID=A0A5N6ZWI4_9EURO|nr:uncharacterized protein BDV27DRAFT_133244 [Aspergillus caelatus]KAE8361316.1 hypothetical protein BDV27DRAFT_133244 [Aspergillus caelatus]